MTLNNETQTFNTTQSISTIIVTLELVQQRFINKLPLIITSLGLIGFLGNVFTFLQPALRYNSFCIYTLCGSLIDIITISVNLLPVYLDPISGYTVAIISNRVICKLKMFALLFLPQLSMDLLILSLIDRYASTYGPTSSMRYLLKLKFVPCLIGLTVIITCLVSFYALLINDIIPGYGCGSTNPTLNSILYIVLHGIITPVTMMMLMLLTYRRFKLGRQRVGAVVIANQNRFRNQFIAMSFAQTFVTSLFAMQWIIMYWYFLSSVYSNKTAEEWAIIYFVFSLTNNLYYLINVRSFYLSTLTSRLFRNTLITAVLKLLPGNLYQRWDVRNQNMITTAQGRIKREDMTVH